MKSPRGLSPGEAELWARLAASIVPLKGRVAPAIAKAPTKAAVPARVDRPKLAPPPPPKMTERPIRRTRPFDRQGLDASWERKLAKAALAPDFTLDLHGATLDSAHDRLDRGLMQARNMGARLVLVVTGKPRPTEAADRGQKRGAIRAKILDWLAAGPHGDAIAAIRSAHRKHGGSGALYIVLRRAR
jgi:DNA-nicking Smr family endonuclease